MGRNYWATILYSGGSEFLSAIRSAEERGLAGVAVPQVYGPPFVPLAAAATVTTRIQLATGIAIGLTRSPFETAMAALDLDHLSQGRFILGLGTGPVHWTRGYFGMPYDKPVSRLREVVQILRHVEDGARTGKMKPWQGDCYRLEFHAYEPTAQPHRERIPVWIAALRERMCELAGEVAEGLIGHPIWSVEWSLGQAQKSLATGAARTGRDPAKIHFQPWVITSIDRDPRVAVNEAKPSVAFYAGFAQYHPYFAAHGFAAEARKLQEASKSMSCAEAAHLVPDEMARTFVACGTPDEVREVVEPLWQRANSMMINPPTWGLSLDRQAVKVKAIAETFWTPTTG
jgi:probable F420-dependent oxidoreductase